MSFRKRPFYSGPQKAVEYIAFVKNESPPDPEEDYGIIVFDGTVFQKSEDGGAYAPFGGGGIPGLYIDGTDDDEWIVNKDRATGTPEDAELRLQGADGANDWDFVIKVDSSTGEAHLILRKGIVDMVTLKFKSGAAPGDAVIETPGSLKSGA